MTSNLDVDLFRINFFQRFQSKDYINQFIKREFKEELLDSVAI